MITNSYMTLYNAYYNPTTEATEYKKTYLYGVNWQITQAVSVAEKGLNSADALKVYIPSNVLTGDSVYIDAKEFERLATKEGYYTFKPGDILVRGTINFDITGEKGKTAKDLFNNYTEVYTLKSIIDNRQTSISHWELGGV